jgi:hypothetical protein
MAVKEEFGREIISNIMFHFDCWQALADFFLRDNRGMAKYVRRVSLHLRRKTLRDILCDGDDGYDPFTPDIDPKELICVQKVLRNLRELYVGYLTGIRPHKSITYEDDIIQGFVEVRQSVEETMQTVPYKTVALEYGTPRLDKIDVVLTSANKHRQTAT